MIDKKNKIDIRPPLSIYNIFENLSYTLDSAFAEFIDNSTQAFKDNKGKLESSINDYVPKIYIIYYADKGKEKIQIIDNCYGIKNDKIDRVLKLNIRPQNDGNSRNEYGMGLKTAAFWFGKKLSIISKCSDEDFTTDVLLSLDKLEDNVPVNYKDKDFFQKSFGFECGTILEINSLYKQNLPKNQQLIRLGKIFSSKYRYDIQNENLEMHIIKKEDNKLFSVYNDEIIEIHNLSEAKKITFYKEKFKIDEKTGKEQKILIDDYLDFEGNKYHITGEVGILSKGSRDNAGLILFRRQRSVLGDEKGKRYKPYKIFKDGASFEYQRIYGVINLDDFPIFQAKNGFRWENGLETAFIDFLYEKITTGNLNIIYIAKTSRNKKSDLNLNKINNSESAKEIQDSINADNNNIRTEIKYDDEKSEFNITIGEDYRFRDKVGSEIVLKLSVIKGDESSNKWLNIKRCAENEYNVILDLNTHFFDPFNNDEENVKQQIIKFCLYFAYSEIIHSRICGNSSEQRGVLNRLLKGEIKNE